LLRAKLRAHGEGLTSTGYEDKVLVALSRPAPPSAT
jgi:hypothetical protein